MAQKTIPELNAETTFGANALFFFDSGTQSFKILASNVAQNLRVLATPPTVVKKTAGFTLDATYADKVIPLDTLTVGAFNIQLPDPATMAGMTVYLKDVAGVLSTAAVSLLRNAAEKIEELSATYKLEANYGGWILFCDGTDWRFI